MHLVEDDGGGIWLGVGGIKLGVLKELLKELWVTCLVHRYVNNGYQGSGPAPVSHRLIFVSAPRQLPLWKSHSEGSQSCILSS